MLELVKGAKLIVETCAGIKPGEKVLVVADDEVFPMQMGRIVMDVANSAGADAVLMVMKPREISGEEPPQAVALAMKSVNAVIYITNRWGIGHTDARKEATAAGVRCYSMVDVPEDCFKQDISVADIHQIKERTEKMAAKLTRARQARITGPGGTDLTMGLEGRPGLPLHPMWEVLGGLPDYAEAAISPVEGTTSGTLVIDIGVIGWRYLLRQPIRCQVKSGRVVEVSGNEDADRFRKLSTTDENASNIAELGIGTSHTIPRIYRATRRDGGMAGNIHIAIGRNNDIGGQTWSRIHQDGLVDRPTVELDGEVIVRDGALV
ncbi:MAG: aminopeptidase [Chloroflexota bacterium]